MPTLKGPRPGTPPVPFVISKEGAQRYLVGLSWDPREAPKLDVNVSKGPRKGSASSGILHALMMPFEFLRVLFLTIIKQITNDMHQATLKKDDDAEGRDVNANQYDLDLDCYIYDADFNLKTIVGVEDGELIDSSKRVYHSGDNQGGGGGGDDEKLFVETRGLPADYHHIYFVVKSDCKFSMAEFKNASIRLADSKTEVATLQNSLAPPEGMPKMFNYVFCRVSRDGEGWSFENIDEFTDDGVKWEEYLPTLPAIKAA
ncbi:MAG: TerD family protein [Alphaproteobacteria bacterium]